MEIKLDSINKNNTWTLTTLPINQKAIGLKWVNKAKRDAKGKIIKYKARLVAKALAAYHGWQVPHLDVKSAFIHGDLKEEVYVTQPEGFIQQGNSGKVYKLTKALNGLRQEPRAWNIKLDQTLKSLDFKKCNLEQAVYTKRSKTSTLIVEVYVDDLIITGTPRKELECTQKQPIVALSSCESELMTATGAACQALWLKRLLSKLTGWEEKRITLKVDNISAIALVRNLVFHERSKHIDIRYHFIRECVEKGHINVEHVSGELQRPDILTKALPRLKFITTILPQQSAYYGIKDAKPANKPTHVWLVRLLGVLRLMISVPSPINESVDGTQTTPLEQRLDMPNMRDDVAPDDIVVVI
nr:ribonuclease H-like domain, reverse transcriptase, RNA-dependent DNA polymerase [Tanacetum cinerariifolium]